MENKFILMCIIIIIGCVPPSMETPTADVEVYVNLEECDDLPPCNAQLSISSGYIQTHEWRQAIDNYKKLFLCACPEIKTDADEIYKWLGYSYRNLQLYDSAAFVFKQGLKYTPEDIDLLIWAGENSGKMNDIEGQIYYYDKILSIEENNLEVLELLSNVFRDQGMF